MVWLRYLGSEGVGSPTLNVQEMGYLGDGTVRLLTKRVKGDARESELN